MQVYRPGIVQPHPRRVEWHAPGDLHTMAAFLDDAVLDVELPGPVERLERQSFKRHRPDPPVGDGRGETDERIVELAGELQGEIHRAPEGALEIEQRPEEVEVHAVPTELHFAPALQVDPTG